MAADGFEKDPTAVLSPAVTEERGFWMMVRNPHWAERYGGRFDDVQKLLQASEREMRRQKITKATLGFTFIGLVAFAIFWFTSARNKYEIPFVQPGMADCSVLGMLCTAGIVNHGVLQELTQFHARHKAIPFEIEGTGSSCRVIVAVTERR